eukprot:gene9928-biopygen2542
MTAIDFTAAFDKARRAKFYKKLLDRGFPPFVVRWARAFLTDRTGKVRVGDQASKARKFFEGFPQGTVLGPVFWDLYVDDLVEALTDGLPSHVQVEVVLYADDVTLLVCGQNLVELYRWTQRALDNLASWEARNDATVSLDKTTVTVFVPRTRAIKPKLLGLTYDERLTSKPHLVELRGNVQKRRNAVAALSGTKWGCDLRTLRSIHLAYVQSKAVYALAAFGPFVPPTMLDGLRVEQNNAARLICGCPGNTREVVALLEADLRSVHQRGLCGSGTI